MLSVVTFLPLLVCTVLPLLPRTLPNRANVWVWIVTAAVDLAQVVALWASYDTQGGIAVRAAGALDPQRRGRLPRGRRRPVPALVALPVLFQAVVVRHDAYVQSWRDAHELSQQFATAVHAGNTDEARRLLDALMAMADQWKSHPDFPAATRAVRAVHDADTTAER